MSNSETDLLNYNILLSKIVTNSFLKFVCVVFNLQVEKFCRELIDPFPPVELLFSFNAILPKQTKNINKVFSLIFFLKHD